MVLFISSFILFAFIKEKIDLSTLLLISKIEKEVSLLFLLLYLGNKKVL